MAALLAAAAMAQPLAAAAQPAAPAAPSGTALEQAREKYQRGAEAYKARRYQEAIDRFLEADRLASSPAFAFNVAVAYEDLGDRARALHWFRAYLRRAPNAKDRADIERRISRLQGELHAKGVQQVSVESVPEGAKLTVDGRPVGTTPWAGELAPGKHVAAAQLDGHREARQEFVLAPDQPMDVSLSLAPDEQRPSTPADPVAVDRAQPLEAPGVRPLTWISLGVGALGLGGALGFELARSAAEDDANQAPTQLEALEAAETMGDRRTISRVLLGVGAAATVAGGVLLIIDLTRDPQPRSASAAGVRAAFGCRPARCSATLDGAF
jgi:tetratricopeptide (TPR) repeat protein